MAKRIGHFGDPLTMPGVVPLPKPGDAPLPAPFAEGALAVAKVPPHDVALLEVKPDPKASFFYELSARLDAGEAPSEAMLDDAIKHKSVRSVWLLVSLGINLDKPDEDGNTRLHIACKTGNVKVVKILLEHGASISGNANYQTPVDFAFATLPDATLFPVFHEIAKHAPEGVQRIWSGALRHDRDDVLAWLFVEKHKHPGWVMDFHVLPSGFLKNLDAIFRSAADAKDAARLTNCVEVLSNVIARREPEAANEARRRLVDWVELAGEAVVEAYARKREAIDAPYKLLPYDEEIKIVADTTANWHSIVGDIVWDPHS
jgi:hypothetical protein